MFSSSFWPLGRMKKVAALQTVDGNFFSVIVWSRSEAVMTPYPTDEIINIPFFKHYFIFIRLYRSKTLSDYYFIYVFGNAKLSGKEDVRVGMRTRCY